MNRSERCQRSRLGAKNTGAEPDGREAACRRHVELLGCEAALRTRQQDDLSRWRKIAQRLPRKRREHDALGAWLRAMLSKPVWQRGHRVNDRHAIAPALLAR